MTESELQKSTSNVLLNNKNLITQDQSPQEYSVFSNKQISIENIQDDFLNQNEFSKNQIVTKEGETNQKSFNIIEENNSFKEKTGTDKELFNFIDVVYEVYLEEMEAQSIEVTPEKQTSNKSLKKEQLDFPINNLRDKKQFINKIPKCFQKSKPFQPKSIFQMEGLILEKMKTYNGLSDFHLTSFLNQNNRREILIKNGLLTEEGFIISRPDDFLTKKQFYDKIKDFNEKPINFSGELPKIKVKSPYHNCQYADYKQKLYQAAKLHQKLVNLPGKKGKNFQDYEKKENAISKQARKKTTVKSINTNLNDSDRKTDKIIELEVLQEESLKLENESQNLEENFQPDFEEIELKEETAVDVDINQESESKKEELECNEVNDENFNEVDECYESENREFEKIENEDENKQEYDQNNFEREFNEEEVQEIMA